MKRILYISSRTGLAEPLGRSQVLPYMLELSKNHKIHIISTEKKVDLENEVNINNIENLLHENNIIWHYSVFKYGKKSIPLALINDIFIGIFFCIKYKINIIHCRGYLPNLVGIAIKFLLSNKLIFDMRGLWPEEIALGLKKRRKSFFYKFLKFSEIISIYYSDKVISLTNRAKDYLIDLYRINPKSIITIPTCVDIKRFEYSEPIYSKNKKFSCIGTILSDWFLTDWLSLFFRCVEKYDSKANYEIISTDNKKDLMLRLNLNISLRNKLHIRSATPDEMPSLIKNHSASSFFFKPDISKLGSSPTRFGEILAVGRPVICNSGVGDLDELVIENDVGIVVQEAKYSLMMEGVEKLYKMCDNPNTSIKCRKLAENYYSLFSGTRKYSNIYDNEL